MSQPLEHAETKANADHMGSVEPDTGSDYVTVRPEKTDGFTLRRSDQAVAMVLAGIVILLCALQWIRLSGWGVHPIEIGELSAIENEFRLDINTATAIEWSQLDRIGEVLADRIVEDRKTNGNFETIDDLNRVDGIGPQTLEQIRPWLTIKLSD
jgi:competence protein ComEA